MSADCMGAYWNMSLLVNFFLLWLGSESDGDLAGCLVG